MFFSIKIFDVYAARCMPRECFEIGKKANNFLLKILIVIFSLPYIPFFHWIYFLKHLLNYVWTQNLVLALQ